MLAVCAAIVVSTPADTYWIVDNANRGLVATRLLETGFAELTLEHPGRAVDPKGRAFPIRGYAVRRGDGYVSIYPPAYSALAAPFLAALGPHGLRAPAALGVAACAVLFVLWLAPALGLGWAAAGALVLALATPLLFTGVTVWENGLTAALALAAWLALERGDARGLAGAGVLLGLGCWLREELALLGVAVAVCAALRWRRGMPLVWLAAGAAPPLVALLAFNRAVFGDPLGLHVLENVRPADVSPSLSAIDFGAKARQSFSALAGYGASATHAALLAGLGALAVVTGALWVRRGERPAWGLAGVTLLALAGWAAGFVALLRAQQPLYALVLHAGLSVQMPLAGLAGAGWVRLRRDPRFEGVRWGVAAALLFTGLVVAIGPFVHTAFGMGVRWGPRTLAPAFAGFVALALAALAGRGALRRAAAAAFAAAGLLSSGLAVALLHAQKSEAAALQRELLERSEDVVVFSDTILAQHLAGIWGRKTVLLAEHRAELQRLERAIAASGARRYLLLPGLNLAGRRIDGGRCPLAFRHRGAWVRYLDLDVRVCTLGDSPRAGVRGEEASR